MNRISRKPAVALTLVVFLFSSCNPGSYKPLFKSKFDGITDTLKYVGVVNSKAPGSNVYRIQPADILSIRSIKIEEITDGAQGGGGQSSQNSGSSSGGFRVEDDGTVNLPVVGKVYVKDLSRREATDKIQELYKASYLKDPLMDVSVLNPKVTIFGEVTAPGVYTLQRENTSLVEIIALAGGFTRNVDAKTLKIVRGDKRDAEIIYVNLEHLATLSDPRIILQNNDVIYVEPDKRYARYEKSQSGFGIFQTVLVVISTGLLLFTSFFK